MTNALRKITVTSADRPAHVDPGAAPMLQWIRIDDLVVDERYQRELKVGNWNNIRSIAKDFKWSRFSPVFVAPIDGGRFAIIDGQHRVHAAAMCGMAEVPCQIVQMSHEEQAASFAAVNGIVTKVTVWQIYKAALAAKETWAVELQEIGEQSGVDIKTTNSSNSAKRPGEIYGVSSFRNVLKKRPREAVIACLKKLKAVQGFSEDATYWSAGIIEPVLMALTTRPDILERDDFAEAFSLFDIHDALEEIGRSIREKLKAGLPYLPRKEALEQEILGWMDACFSEEEA